MTPYTFRGVTIPAHLQESLEAWHDTGRPTGSFLERCINNDLAGAMSRGDATSITALPAIVAWLYSVAELRSWGRAGCHDAWCERKRVEREMAQ